MQFKSSHWAKQWLKDRWQYFVRQIDRSVPFRLLLSLLAAYAALFTVKQIEDNYKQANQNLPPQAMACQTSFTCVTNEFISLISVDNLEGFSILVLAILYLLESRDRKKQKHYEAWQVIDQAAAAKVPTSYARIQALQDLNKDGVSLLGLDVPKADLKRIDLRGADLREATLSGADLRNANLSEVNLQGANINGANLEGVDLCNANLYGVNFKHANLTKTNLKGANLTKANLSKANLAGAELAGVNLLEANLAGTNLTNANLGQANLKGARLRETHREGADFKGANLTGATMPDGTVHN